MAFDHQPLSQEDIGPGAFRVIGPDAPAPMRGMVAKGLAPLPPRDLLVALYVLWLDDPQGLGEDAAKTITTLPGPILAGALADPNVPAGVLDFVARKLARKEEVLELVVRHPRAHDETLAALARVCPESICDVLSDNQQRWLAHPAIVESLYQNPNCRMSVAQRMIELALRQGVELRLPNIEEIRQALGDGAAPEAAGEQGDRGDRVFRRAMGRDVMQQHNRLVQSVETSGAAEDVDPDAMREETSEVYDGLDIDALLAQAPADDLSLPMGPEDELPPEPEPDEPEVAGDRLSQITRLPVMHKIRLAMLGNGFERSVLIRDANKQVAMSAIKSTRVKENEVVAFAANRALPHEVVRYIANRREWLKLYQVKFNLVLNPKTPLSAAMGFLNHLHAHDVRKVSRSRNIPSALSKAAKRKEAQRR